MTTWRQMEKLVERGLVRHIGTSNMTIPKLGLVLRDAAIKPACNEMELHPHFQQPELFRFVVEQGMVPIGFSPIGSPKRPDRDRTETDTVDIEDPVIVRIAQRLAVHPAVVCVKWAVQRGQIPIPFSVHRENYLSNLRGVGIRAAHRGGDGRQIGRIDRNCRLIKGQVFLWKDAHSWELGMVGRGKNDFDAQGGTGGAKLGGVEDLTVVNIDRLRQTAAQHRHLQHAFQARQGFIEEKLTVRRQARVIVYERDHMCSTLLTRAVGIGQPGAPGWHRTATGHSRGHAQSGDGKQTDCATAGASCPHAAGGCPGYARWRSCLHA